MNKMHSCKGCKEIYSDYQTATCTKCYDHYCTDCYEGNLFLIVGIEYLCYKCNPYFFDKKSKELEDFDSDDLLKYAIKQLGISNNQFIKGYKNYKKEENNLGCYECKFNKCTSFGGNIFESNIGYCHGCCCICSIEIHNGDNIRDTHYCSQCINNLVNIIRKTGLSDDIIKEIISKYYTNSEYIKQDSENDNFDK